VFTQAQLNGAGPLLVIAIISAVMMPIGERLVKYRLRSIYDDTQGVVYGLDLYSTATLAVVVPVVGLLFVPGAAINGRWIGIAYLVAFLADLIALVLVLTTEDYNRYVIKRRFLFWSYPTCLSLVAMIVGALVSGALS
jgi:hypothetical protein